MPDHEIFKEHDPEDCFYDCKAVHDFMAKAHGLNIYGYLKFLLEHRPGKDMTDEQLAELAPWSEKLQSIKNRM